MTFAGKVTVDAWNTECGNGFDCEVNAELYGYFLRQEPIAVLLLVDRQAKWNQELENVYLVACEINDDGRGHRRQHYAYELRPDDCA
jgi:hypothetical protein